MPGLMLLVQSQQFLVALEQRSFSPGRGLGTGFLRGGDGILKPARLGIGGPQRTQTDRFLVLS